MRKDPIHNTQKKHTGVDFIAKQGTEVLATADGVIDLAEFADNYGNHIMIKHDAEYSSHYAHLLDINVKNGTKVRIGDVIGRVGSTGQSTGDHLHYEVIKNKEKVDPADYFQYELLEKK